MLNKKILRRAWVLLAYAALSAYASPIPGGGPESPSNDWYQWTNSGPVLTTVQSMSDFIDGNALGPDLFGPGNGPQTQGPGDDEGPFLHGIPDSPFECQTDGQREDRPESTEAVPEPGSLVLLGLGLFALGMGVRRRI